MSARCCGSVSNTCGPAIETDLKCRGVHGLASRRSRRLQLPSARRDAAIGPRAAASHVAAGDQSHHRAARSAGLPRAASGAERRASPDLSHAPYLGMVKVVHATLLEILSGMGRRDRAGPLQRFHGDAAPLCGARLRGQLTAWEPAKIRRVSLLLRRCSGQPRRQPTSGVDAVRADDDEARGKRAVVAALGGNEHGRAGLEVRLGRRPKVTTECRRGSRFSSPRRRYRTDRGFALRRP